MVRHKQTYSYSYIESVPVNNWKGIYNSGIPAGRGTNGWGLWVLHYWPLLYSWVEAPCFELFCTPTFVDEEYPLYGHEVCSQGSSSSPSETTDRWLKGFGW